MKTIGFFSATYIRRQQCKSKVPPIDAKRWRINVLSQLRSAPLFAVDFVPLCFCSQTTQRNRAANHSFASLAVAQIRLLRSNSKRGTCKRLACSQSSRIAFDLPDLLDIQRASFNKFVRHDMPHLFSQLAPIRVEGEKMVVELHLDGKNFKLITPDETPQDCIYKLKTYSSQLYIEAKIVYKTVENKVLYSTESEWVLIGHLPLMTRRGHFIINGSPRVIVHQVLRSPGIYFQQVVDKDNKQIIRFYGDIIPRRGVWLRLQTTKKGKIEAKLKKGKKVSADMLQRCLQLIERFERERWGITSRTLRTTNFAETSSAVAFAEQKHESLNLKNSLGLRCKSTGKLTPTVISKLPAPFYERVQATIPLLAHDTTSKKNYLQTPALLHENGSADAVDVVTSNLKMSDTSFFTPSTEMADELNTFKNAPEEKALVYTYDKLYRPAEEKEREEISKKEKDSSFSADTLTDRHYKLKRCYKNLFSTFKEKDRYDLGFLGREKINTKLGIYVPNNQLTALDICAASSWLHKLTKGEKNVDDIDNSQNRRIRTSGELLYAQFENGVDRLRKLTWNKVKQFVHLQAVQTFLDSQNSRQSSAEVGDTHAKNNVRTVFTKSHFDQAEIDDERNTVSTHSVNGTKSSTKSKNLHASLSASQTKLRSTFSSKLLSKSLSSSQAERDVSDRSVKRKNRNNSPQTVFYKKIVSKVRTLAAQVELNGGFTAHTPANSIFSASPISLTENFPVVKNKKSDKRRYHIRNTRSPGSDLAVELIREQQHLLSDFGYLEKRYWVRQLIQQKRTSLSKSHRKRNVKILGSKKNSFVKTLLSANSKNSNKSNCTSSIQAKLALPSLKEFLSTKPLNGALRELFGSNPLSQYMDQTNPLAEITHKRRMSSLGVGGVSRESAGMAIRGIHPTHYNRICPIETPEGKNAGLVNSLAVYAKIDNKGFLETPYYQVVKGQVQNELGFTFFSAKRESTSHLNIAASDLQQSWSRMLATDSVPVRTADNRLDIFKKIHSYQVDCIGLAPVQMISIATSLIPFLEHNDANRALMGSNMQRQAVPLMIAERAIVGTGFESLVVAESGHILQSELAGFISYVSANKIVVDSLCCAKKNALLSTRNRKKVLKGIISHPSTASIAMEPANSFATEAAIPFCKEKDLYKTLSLQKNRSDQLRSSVDRTGNAHRRGQACSSTSLFASISGWSLKRNASFLVATLCFCGAKTTQSQAKTTQTTQKQDKLKNAKRSDMCYSVSQTAFIESNLYHNTFLPVKRRYSQAAQQDGARTHAFLASLRKNINYDRTETSLLAANDCSIVMGYSTAYSKKVQRLRSFVHRVSNFDRSNQDTCLTQRALVKEGDWVQKGDILTDCSASDKGELAVGKNILVAYIPWEGYNFEDAIVISERLVKEHVYTSLHIERYDFNAQKFKEGSEWFTNDLPGISSTKVKHLDEFGLPKIGSFVKEGDILLGKIRYSNKKVTTPYERLLCDILGENNFSARDSSLYVPKGVHARVIKRKVLTFFDDVSKVRSKRKRSPKRVHVFLGEKRAIQVGDKMSGRHGNKGVVSTILPRQDMPYLADGTAIDIVLNPLGVPSRMNVGQVFESLLGLAGTYLAQHFKIMCFDELYGVEASQSIVYLKLYQARLQSGQNWLFQVDFPGKTRLIDGRSGQSFDQWITVGKAYILKLIHMVNEKIHARATGPYALITQQPLRGRSQKGGQRLGEMEVWALEGFGAAYTLQELLTKKSDDMVGRKEVASAILPRPISILDIVQPANRTKENNFLLGQPEIFKVLVCELQALCLDVGVYSLTNESFQRTFISKVNSI